MNSNINLKEEDFFLAAEALSADITHIMALIRLIVIFLCMLPINILFFVATHFVVLLVSVFRDVSILVFRFYLDFTREMRSATI
jgi:hypothetical protein